MTNLGQIIDGYSFFASSTNRSAFVSPNAAIVLYRRSQAGIAIPEMSRLSSTPLGTSRSKNRNSLLVTDLRTKHGRLQQPSIPHSVGSSVFLNL
jgi:hypothetical protein